MDNRLKHQLAQIKKRAIWLRRRGEARAGSGEPDGAPAEAATAPPAPVPTAADAEATRIVDEVVATGAVTRGADFDRMRTLRRSWSRHSGGVEREGEDVLEALMTGDPVTLEAAAPGSGCEIDGSPYYLVRPIGSDVDDEEPAEARAFARLRRWPEDVVVGAARGRRPRKDPAQQELDLAIDPARVLFLDIETAGLSANTYLFLCGLMFMEDGRFVVEQPFARDYQEEAGVLRHVARAMRRFDVVVTYNGATFDLPFIRTRLAMHRLSPSDPPGSVDLLHAARRVFRDILPNRRLVTVERHLRGFDRRDDIPSRYIPQAWHDFVRSGDARAMRNVLYHNRMDLFTMAVILNRFAEREA